MEIKIFEKEEFGSIRTIVQENDRVLFAGIDVAKSLGYANPNEAIINHCKSSNIEKCYVPHLKGMGGVNIMFIPESELYRLVMRSKQENAELFQDWVCEDVLPSIRKKGIYATDQTIDNIVSDPDFGIRLLTELKQEREEKQKALAKIEEDKPLVEFAEKLIECEDAILIRDFVKIVQSTGIPVKEKKFYSWLRANKYLSENNIPLHKGLHPGYFKVKEGVHNGKIRETPLITGKGQQYFLKRLKEMDEKRREQECF